MPVAIRDLLICLSLSNLLFVKIWCRVSYITKEHSYDVKYLPNTNSYLAVMLNVLLVALIFWIGISVVRRIKNKTALYIAKIIFVSIFLLMVYLFMDVYNFNLIRDIPNWGKPFAYTLFLIALVHWRRPVFNSSLKLVLILSIFTMFTFGQTIYMIFGTADQFVTLSPTKNSTPVITKAEPSERVIWIIFDELDYRLTFVDRPRDLPLPVFDSIAHQGVFAVNAYPPGHQTIYSVPSLLTGRKVSKVKVANYNSLMLTFEDEPNKMQRWGSGPNIFRELRGMGVKTALVGWYNPYPRIFGNDIDFCYYEPYGYETRSSGEKVTLKNIIANMIFQFSNFSPYSQRLQAINSYTKILEKSVAVLHDQQYGFIFLHLPVPHEPYVYENKTGNWVLKNFRPLDGYFANLALADKTLGELRAVLKETGSWDKSHIIISSDHWFRLSGNLTHKESLKVPYIIKLAQQQTGLKYEPIIKTIITHDLVMALIKKEIRNKEELVEWLQQRGANNFERP